MCLDLIEFVVISLTYTQRTFRTKPGEVRSVCDTVRIIFEFCRISLDPDQAASKRYICYLSIIIYSNAGLSKSSVWLKELIRTRMTPNDGYADKTIGLRCVKRRLHGRWEQEKIQIRQKAQSAKGLCFTSIYSIVSKVTAGRQRRPWSDCAEAQADLGIRYPHMYLFTVARFKIIQCFF